MIDTVNLVFKTKNIPNGEIISKETGIKLLYSILKNISYCDKLFYIPNEDSIRLRLSYPRVFDRTNAYLVKTSEECQKVHKKLIDDILFLAVREDLKMWFKKYVTISITRVEIPFTYYIRFDEKFNDYCNVFKLMSEAFHKKIEKGTTKDIGRTASGERETFTICDDDNLGAYGKRIIIYNQARKMQDIYSKKPKIYEDIINKYPYLKFRVRIEVSQRLRLKAKSFDKFYEFKIYEKYVIDFAKYILDNVLDRNTMLDVYYEKSAVLSNLLEESRKSKDFNYKCFIFKNKDKIYDYKILRDAVFRTTENSNTKYSASSTAKEVLKELERETGIIYLNTKAKIKDITDFFQKIVKGV